MKTKMKAKKKITLADLANARRKKLAKYPKGMTVRYTLEQEKQIQALMERTGDKTMSKALLKAPSIMKSQHEMIQELQETLRVKNDKIYELAEIVDSWAQFNAKLEEFLNKK